jgi:hypothetical protein
VRVKKFLVGSLALSRLCPDPSEWGNGAFQVDTAAAIFHGVTDRLLVNVEHNVIDTLHGGASLVESESADAEFSVSTTSAPPRLIH